MKKLLTVCLALILCLATLSACTTPAPTTPDATTATTPETTTGNSTPDNTPPDVVYNLESAKAFVKDLYRSYLESPQTPDDYELVSVVKIAGADYAVAWTVNTDKIVITPAEDSAKVLVDLDEEATEALDYVLTATITAPDGTSTTLSFNLQVPAFAVLSFEDYMATEANTAVVVSGVVTSISSKSEGSSKNQIYAQSLNNDGGFYVYTIKDDKDPVADLGLQVGMTVLLRGTKDIYQGTHEIKDTTIEIVDSTITTLTPVDITDIVAAAETNKDEALASKLGMLITIKGVQLGGQNLETNKYYYYFELGNVESYIRITDYCLPAAERDALIAKHINGYVADVTGIGMLYNGVLYLDPISVDSISNAYLPTRTDAEKIELELGAITVPGKVTSDTTVQLPLTGTTYSDVTFAWTSDNENAVIDANGLLTITVPNGETTVTLTLTITCGEATDTKTYEILLSKTATPLDEINEIGNGLAHDTTTTDKYLVSGVVVEIVKEDYGNLYIADANGNRVYVYGTYNEDGSIRYDAMENKPVVGDYVTFLSVVSNYNGPQLKSAWVLSVEKPTSLENAAAAADGTEVIVTGTVSEIAGAWNEQYGNMNVIITDGTNTLYIFRLALKVEVGDTITLKGVMGTYNENRQIAQGSIVLYYVAAQGGTTPTPPAGEVTIAEALELEDGTEVTVSGTVTEIVKTWNTQYNNMDVKISDGTGELYIFRIGTEVAVGDALTLKGTMSTYNDVRQLAQGCEVVSHTPAGTTPTPPAGEVSIADALAAADGTNVVVTGVVKVASEWNTQYNNMNVTITDGTNELYIYRLGTQVELGDIITVTGVMATYSNSRQIGQGATAEIKGDHDCNNFYEDATCSDPKTCEICGATTGDALGHTEPDGNGCCTRCGQNLSLTYAESTIALAGTTGNLVDTTISWADDHITVSNSKGASTNDIRTSDSDHFRIYKSSTFAITANGSETISSVVFTAVNSDYAAVLVTSLEGAGYTATADGSVVTLTLDTPVAEITCVASAQFRLTQVEVTYIAG